MINTKIKYYAGKINTNKSKMPKKRSDCILFINDIDCLCF